MDLVQSNSGDVYLDTGNQLLSFDGIPCQRPPAANDWQVVGSEVSCLFDWQRDPGTYGPYYAVGTIVDRDGEMFISAWCAENDASFHNAQLVSDRNEARRRVEQRGGVAW